MRTLFEIVESAKDGEMPTHEECYWAMLAFNAMLNFDHRELRNALLKPSNSQLVRELKAENSFKMYKAALNNSPKEWLGESNNPANPEYQRMRKIGNKLLDKVMAKQGERT